MTDRLIKNVSVMQPGEGVVGSSLLIRQGKIAEISPDPGGAEIPGAESFDGGGRLLTPGLIDIHTHGIGHNLYERSPEELVAGVGVLAQYGVTTVLPTLYKVMERGDYAPLRRLVDTLGQCRGACVPGFHLEGPFLALAGAGASTAAGDIDWLNELLDVCQDKLSAMSISPDTPNIIPVIERLSDAGVVVFITHTAADVDQTDAAIEAGARHATHFYDVFPVPAETDPGVRPVGCVEAVLADRRVSVDFIADGVHVHPKAIQAAFAAKGPEKVILITDSNIGAGLPDGVYETPWGFPVMVEAGRATRTHAPGEPNHGTLAGSSLTMNQGIGNLRRWLDIPEHQVWAMGSRNPAKLMGLAGKGQIVKGADADLVLWDQTGDAPQAVHTWVGGESVFDQTQTDEASIR